MSFRPLVLDVLVLMSFKSFSLVKFQEGKVATVMLLLLCYSFLYNYIYIHVYIFIHLFFYSSSVFTLAILVEYSALCQCAGNLLGGSCVEPEVGASGPETWGPHCLWGHCCDSSLESHVHAVAGSPCIPIPLPCHGFCLACLRRWSPAPPPCSHEVRVEAGLKQCQMKLGWGRQGEGPWVVVGIPLRSWAYAVP